MRSQDLGSMGKPNYVVFSKHWRIFNPIHSKDETVHICCEIRISYAFNDIYILVRLRGYCRILFMEVTYVSKKGATSMRIMKGIFSKILGEPSGVHGQNEHKRENQLC